MQMILRIILADRARRQEPEQNGVREKERESARTSVADINVWCQ